MAATNSTPESNTELTSGEFLLLGIGISTGVTGLLFAVIGLIAAFTSHA